MCIAFQSDPRRFLILLMISVCWSFIWVGRVLKFIYLQINLFFIWFPVGVCIGSNSCCLQFSHQCENLSHIKPVSNWLIRSMEGSPWIHPSLNTWISLRSRRDTGPVDALRRAARLGRLKTTQVGGQFGCHLVLAEDVEAYLCEFPDGKSQKLRTNPNSAKVAYEWIWAESPDRA